MEGYPLNIVSKVGENRTYEESGIAVETVWSEDGSGFEFLVNVSNASAEIKDQLLAALTSNTILPVNIMMYDIDEEGIIDYVLSPFNGDYSDETQYRGEMEIK